MGRGTMNPRGPGCCARLLLTLAVLLLGVPRAECGANVTALQEGPGASLASLDEPEGDGDAETSNALTAAGSPESSENVGDSAIALEKQDAAGDADAENDAQGESDEGEGAQS